jgi:hypothetical protein
LSIKHWLYIRESTNKIPGFKNINWKAHIDQLIPKLSGACYAARSLLHISNTDKLNSISFAYFHMLIKYGIIFWGNSSDSKKVFTQQKKIFPLPEGCNSAQSTIKKSHQLTS